MPFGLDRHGNVYRIPVVDATLVDEDLPDVAQHWAGSMGESPAGPVVLQLVSTGPTGVLARLRVRSGGPAPLVPLDEVSA